MPQIWCEYPDSNWEAEAEDFKSSMFTNFIILANLAEDVGIEPTHRITTMTD